MVEEEDLADLTADRTTSQARIPGNCYGYRISAPRREIGMFRVPYDVIPIVASLMVGSQADPHLTKTQFKDNITHIQGNA